jgi:tyrosyl-tRNA synthetase
MGQYYCRYGTDPEDEWRRGLCAYVPPAHQSRWHQIRKIGRWKCLAGPQTYFSLQILPVLAEQQYIRIFTLLQREEIENLEKEHAQAPHLRALQKALAKDVTIRVHSEEDYVNALKASEILFGKSTTDDLKSIDEDTLLSVFEGVPQVELTGNEYLAVSNIIDLLSVATRSEIFPSKGEARKMIGGGGVSVNKLKIESAEQPLNFELLQDKYLLVQKGKRNYYLIKIV